MTRSRNWAFACMALGFVIWALAFSLLYALQATGCELGWQHRAIGPLSVLRTLLILVWAAHMAALAWLYGVCRPALAAVPEGSTPDLFLWRAATALTVVAIVATIWIGAALLVPSMCAA